MSRFINYIQYVAVAGTAKLAGNFSHKTAASIASFLGSCGALIPPFGGLVRTNLQTAFPEKDDKWIRQKTKESLASLALTLLEFFHLKAHPEEYSSLYTIEPEGEAITRSGAEDKEHALIMITPHFGNWEITGMIMPLHFSKPIATIVRTARNPYLDDLISSGRSVKGVEIIHSKNGMIPLVKAMEKGSCAGLLVDQNTRVRNGGIFVNFFGLKCPVSRSPAVLGRKLNARVIVGCSVRDANGHFTVYAKELPKLPSEYETDEEIMQDIMTISENMIRLAPEQYLWMYKRFQHIPPDAPEELRKRYPAYAAVPPPSFFDIRNKKKT